MERPYCLVASVKFRWQLKTIEESWCPQNVVAMKQTTWLKLFHLCSQVSCLLGIVLVEMAIAILLFKRANNDLMVGKN